MVNIIEIEKKKKQKKKFFRYDKYFNTCFIVDKKTEKTSQKDNSIY